MYHNRHMNKNDPLQTLVSDDAQAIDRKKIAEFLHPLILIDGTSKQISFQPGFEKLASNAVKLEVILLACKVRALLFKVQDGLTQGEIIALDTMPEGSAKTSIKGLFDAKKIKKDRDRRYFLPGYKINELVDAHKNKN